MALPDQFIDPNLRTCRPGRIPLMFSLVVAGLLLGADEPNALSTSEPSFTLIRVDGSTVSGHLRRVDTKAGVTLRDARNAEQTVPIAGISKLVRDDSPTPPPAQGAIILFPEGDRLFRLTVRKADEINLDVQTAGLESLKIPLDQILGVILAAPPEPSSVAALVAKVRETPRNTEVFWLGNGDRLNGSFVGLNEKTISFRPTTGPVELERTNLIAFGFDPSLVTYPRPEGAYFEVGMIDGSRLGMKDLRFEGGYLYGQARFGAPLKIPAADLGTIQARLDSTRFLSDVPALQDRYRDFIGPTRPYRRDLNVLGGPIKLQGKTYEHGLGTQPRTLLAYRIDPGWSRFQATVGLDEQAGPLANVLFRVIVDGKEKASSPPIASRETPHVFDVDIRGAKTLVLITEFSDRGNVHDVADWADARLVR